MLKQGGVSEKKNSKTPRETGKKRTQSGDLEGTLGKGKSEKNCIVVNSSEITLNGRAGVQQKREENLGGHVLPHLNYKNQERGMSDTTSILGQKGTQKKGGQGEKKELHYV